MFWGEMKGVDESRTMVFIGRRVSERSFCFELSSRFSGPAPKGCWSDPRAHESWVRKLRRNPLPIESKSSLQVGTATSVKLSAYR